jgi:chromosome segregation ATPase
MERPTPELLLARLLERASELADRYERLRERLRHVEDELVEAQLRIEELERQEVTPSPYTHHSESSPASVELTRADIEQLLAEVDACISLLASPTPPS